MHTEPHDDGQRAQLRAARGSGGLKVLFTVFMGKKKNKAAKSKNKRVNGAKEAKEEEDVMSIRASLSMLTPRPSTTCSTDSTPKEGFRASQFAFVW